MSERIKVSCSRGGKRYNVKYTKSIAVSIGMEYVRFNRGDESRLNE